MSHLTWPVKDPNEYLDYSVNWSDRLLTDTIALSVWFVPTGIVGDTESDDGTTTTIWISGGTAGTKYDVLNRITTSAGRIMDQTVRLPVKEK